MKDWIAIYCNRPNPSQVPTRAESQATRVPGMAKEAEPEDLLPEAGGLGGDVSPASHHR